MVLLNDVDKLRKQLLLDSAGGDSKKRKELYETLIAESMGFGFVTESEKKTLDEEVKKSIEFLDKEEKGTNPAKSSFSGSQMYEIIKGYNVKVSRLLANAISDATVIRTIKSEIKKRDS